MAEPGAFALTEPRVVEVPEAARELVAVESRPQPGSAIVLEPEAEVDVKRALVRPFPDELLVGPDDPQRPFAVVLDPEPAARLLAPAQLEGVAQLSSGS